MKKIAVILTVYNRKQHTLKCLAGLQSQSIRDIRDIQLDIYLTNDGCTDGTPEAIRKEFPYVNIIEGDGTLFWNRGMRKAWEEAAKDDYDYYLWLNDDTHLCADAIERLLKCAIDKEDKAVVIGSCCSSKDENVITYGGHDESHKLIRDVTTEKKCIIFHGNIVLIPRYVFELIGFNDKRYRHAMGDFDYSNMVYRKGLKAYVAAGVFGVCDLHDSKPKWRDSNVPLKERWKAFHRPGGNGSNPFELFYYRRKNDGFIPACLTFVSNYIHVLMPFLWDFKR